MYSQFLRALIKTIFGPTLAKLDSLENWRYKFDFRFGISV